MSDVALPFSKQGPVMFSAGRSRENLAVECSRLFSATIKQWIIPGAYSNFTLSLISLYWMDSNGNLLLVTQVHYAIPSWINCSSFHFAPSFLCCICCICCIQGVVKSLPQLRCSSHAWRTRDGVGGLSDLRYLN